MTDLIELLRQHPDAKRPAGDGDKARATGLQCVQIVATGEVRVVWHWGVVSFPSLLSERFIAYLRQ